MIVSGKPRVWQLLFYTVPLTTLVFGGCLFGGGDDPVTGPPALDACVDVPANVSAEADGLVASANDLMVDNFDYWFKETGSWADMKRRNPQSALTLYNQALTLAPGHCQAVFGSAMASATMLTQDPKMDAFIKKVESMDGTSEPAAKFGSMAGLMKTTPENAAPALLKLSSGLKKLDRPTVREAQDLIETVVLPKLEQTIAAMETVMGYERFAIRFDVKGDTVEIDRSEVGPGLAGLKVAKAWLTVVAGYNWEVAINGNYDWIDTLSDIDNEDFDHLTPGQKTAADNLLGLFDQGSPFTKVRTGWKTKVQAIPSLLLSAVNDAQGGLRSSIAEARSGTGQQFDPWRAGSGLEADVDTADIEVAIELLERSKKYLEGEVAISYDKGSRTLKVNFPKLFQIDGLQGQLPYFKFYPYTEWNDTVSADTSWSPYFYEASSKEAIAALGLGNKMRGDNGSGYWDLYASYYRNSWDSLPGSVGEVYYYDNDPFTSKRIATFTANADDPCSFTYQKHFDMVGSPTNAGVLWTAHESEGTFRLASCREPAPGTAEFADVYVRTKGPLYFTDAAGKKTMGIEDFEAIKEPVDLDGKIVFRDPTFGGIFPELTNENIWTKVHSLQNVSDRVERTCKSDEWGYEYDCKKLLPPHPSDLDYIVYSLYWLDDIL
ncbi:MAG: hypothetical protein ABIW76_05880 [Fibrobacteria bacterium]